MKCRFLLTVGVILWSTWSGFAIEKTTVNLDNLVKTFEQNPANPQTTMQTREIGTRYTESLFQNPK